MNLIRLRDLPGVQRANDLCRNPRNFDYPQSSYTAAELAEISIRLFGIPEWETWWHAPTPEYNFETGQYETINEDENERIEREEYEVQFHATRLAWAEAEVFWEVIGWDLSDGDGGELLSAHCFARQIIAVTGELIEGAKFTIDGTGRWEPDDIDESESLEERLRREAEQFMIGRSS